MKTTVRSLCTNVGLNLKTGNATLRKISSSFGASERVQNLISIFEIAEQALEELNSELSEEEKQQEI